MKDMIQRILSVVLCVVAFSLTMSAQSFDFSTGPVPETGTAGTATFTADAALSCSAGSFLGTIGNGGVTLDNVTIDLTHTFDGDLDISLISPAGTSLILSDSNGGGGDDYTNTVFMDGGSDINSSTPPFTGTFEAEGGPFATTFDGESPSGEWTLEFVDNFGGDSGQLNSASIMFTVNEDVACDVCELGCSDDLVYTLEAGECTDLVIYDAPAFGDDDICFVWEAPEVQQLVGFEEIPVVSSPVDLGPGFILDEGGVIEQDLPNSITVTGGTAMQFGAAFTGFSVVNTLPETATFTVDVNYTESAPGESGFDFPVLGIDAPAGSGAGWTLPASGLGQNMTGDFTLTVEVEAGGTVIAGMFYDGIISGGVAVFSNPQFVVPTPPPPANSYTLELTEGFESGSEVGPGEYTITHVATSTSNPDDTYECSFTVTVNEFTGNTVSSLTCNGDLNISVNDLCAVELNADMFLEGGPYNCYDDYVVSIDPFQQGNFTPLADIVNADGQLELSLALLNVAHDYMVTDPATGNSCWGTLVFEDKFENIDVTCPADSKLANCSDSTPTNPDLMVITVGACDREVIVTPVLASSNEPECGDAEYVYNYIYNGEVLCTQTVIVTSNPLGFMAPEPVVELPCGTGWSPEEIADYFDVETPTFSKDQAYNPPFCTIDGVRENHEGYRYAYIHYYTQGCGNYADGRGDGVPAGVAADEHPQKVDNNVCSFYATYSDQVLPACAPGCHGNQKIIRTWTMIDWCNPSAAPIVFTQVIKVVDRDAPTIDVDTNNPQTTQVVSVNPWSCAGDFALPHPDVLHDDCTDDVTYSVSGPGNVVYDSANGRWVVSGAPLGENVYTYTAVDCCGNEGTDTYVVSVVDRTPPVPVATQNIVVNLTSAGGDDGIAKIFVESVNNGSYDGCTGVGVEIRRDSEACDYAGNDTYNMGGDFANDDTDFINFRDIDNGQWVKVCCDDLTEVDEDGNAYGIVKVMMRVYDDANGDGVYGTAGDNFNETWVDVRVEKKITPSIICPPDVTLACDMDYTNQDMLGYPTTFSTCGTEAWEVNFSGSLNSCGEGTIRATYSLVNLPSVKCTQRIRVENPYDAFDGSTIRFPRDKTTDCMGDTDPEAPTWTEGPCDFIGYTVDTDTYVFEEGQAGEDACMKVVHTYTVIDWCQYDESNGAEGTWTDIQIYKIVDDEAPVLDCQDSMFDVDANCERSSVTLTNTAVDNGDCASAWLKWQVFVDTWGDGSDDWEFSSFVPTSSTFNNGDTNNNGINDMYIAPTASGDELSITIPEVMTSSMNNHRVVWKVTDGCGNVTQCESTYMVVDKKAPTPYCVNLSSALMENGMVELWAIDFDLGAFDNCTKQEKLMFTFDDVRPVDDNGNVTNPNYNPESRSSAKVFTQCGTIQERVYVWDLKGNRDFCTVNLTIMGENCDGANVSGRAATEAGAGVEAVIASLDAVLPEFPIVNTTDAEGAYAFSGLPAADYNVTMEKNDNHDNGVSTLDLVLIQRHIIELANLDSPYKVIAADINRDNKVSSADVVELRKVVLGIQDEFANNTSWRFVDAGQSFADAMNPFPVDEERSMSVEGSEVASNENFVAVKIGDVNGDAAMNVAGVESEVRSGTTMVLETAEQTVAAGETVQIAISSADFAAVAGYQMTVEFNGLTFVGVEGSAINVNASNVGVISDNVVTMSWSTMDAVSSTDELFVINAIAEKAGNVSNMIKVSDRVISAEAYVGNNLDIHTVALAVRGAELPTATTLMQNEPNPFKQSTNISFELAQAGSATLTVMDVTGKVVRVVTGEYEAGMNTITLNKEDINTVGVLYYTLESGDFSETKSMIIID